MPLIPLDDLSDGRLRPYAGMTDGQLRRGEGFRRDNPDGLFIGESTRVIERALAAGIQPLSLLVEERWATHEQPIIDRFLALDPSLPVFLATVEQFHELTGYEVVRGALAAFARPVLPTVEEVLAGAQRIAVLEDVTNYANMGAIFRSAAALGIDAVLVTPACHDPYYRRCARVSMGAVFQVPWTRIGCDRAWAEKGIPLLHDQGFSVAALALRDESVDLRELARTTHGKLALVLGTEGEGLADDTIARCDSVVRSPMKHGVDSLNVAACAAIAFWEITR